MAVRTRDWLKFGALVAIAFIFGLAFASTLNLPKRGGAAEPAASLQPVTAPLGPTAAAQVTVPKSVSDLGDAFVAVAEHVKPAVVFLKAQKAGRAHAPRLPPRVEDFL